MFGLKQIGKIKTLYKNRFAGILFLIIITSLFIMMSLPVAAGSTRHAPMLLTSEKASRDRIDRHAGVCSNTISHVGDTIPFANTIRIYETDSPETVIAKAAHVVPSPRQMKGMEREFIAFLHFGPNTFSGREWGTGKEDPALFNPSSLDTDQWVKTLKDAGMKMIILTVKHHDGYVLWQSRYTRHGICSSPFMDGKGDILRSLSESARKYGMELGIYLSPADLYQIENPDGLYGNLSKPTKRTIPRQIAERPFKDPRHFEFVVDDYNEYYLNQLFEILTEYGPISEVWLDGAHPKRKGGQTYNYAAWRKLIRTLAPEALIFGREDVRWCGNEAGDTRPTERNVLPYTADPDTLQVFRDITDPDPGAPEKLLGAKFLHYQYPETDTSIRDGWFYRDSDSQKVRSADEVFDIYERCVGGNSVFLLNVPPARDGKIEEKDAAVLREVGNRIRRTYGYDLLEGAVINNETVDGEPFSVMTITPPSPVVINRLLLQEPISETGERIESFSVDILSDGTWKKIAEATNIGYKRILRFDDIKAEVIRIRIHEARLEPRIKNISAHLYDSGNTR